jgi:pantoate kinase
LHEKISKVTRVNKTAKAFAPAAISSFFAIHDSIRRKPIVDLERVGAIGGGFGLGLGVHTKVSVKESGENSCRVSINSVPAAEAKTTQKVVEALLAKSPKKYSVEVEHRIDVPVGMGFGTSAGGALTAGLALSRVIGLPLTYNQIGAVAHVAEIQCQTGLGTVSSLTYGGGCILVVEPGAPGICKIDRIPITPDYKVVVGFFPKLIPKKTVFNSQEIKDEVNRYGRKTLQAILAKPSLQSFLDCCWDFSQKAGFSTGRVRELVALAKEAGAVGAAQNMIGEAVHAVVLGEKAGAVEEAFKRVLPQEQIMVSNIDFQGVRLIE